MTSAESRLRASFRQDLEWQPFVLMQQAVDVLLDGAVTDEFKMQRAVALRSEALRLASIDRDYLASLIEAANETIRVFGPHKGAHTGGWNPVLLRLREALQMVKP